MAFADNLSTLPSIDHLSALELIDSDGNIVASIENKPGKAGSLKVYHALTARHGQINGAAAREGIALFGEHVDDAKANPGKHPNIDRLLQILDSGIGLTVRLIHA
jgi:hypothetical protein